MPPSIRQTNFSAGELAPLYWGRTDLSVFPRGLRTCRNFFITKSGAAMSRPGTKFVHEAKVIEWSAVNGGQPDRPVRLQRFVFSDRKSYVLEFGHLYVRFHTLGGTLFNGDGTVYEIATTFAAADIWKLRFAQAGNVITIVAAGYDAVELRRNGDLAWALTETSFTPPEPALPDVGDSFFLNPFTPGVAPQLITTTPFVIIASLLGAADADHPAREWVHAFTAVMQRRSDGVILESLATVVKYSHADGVETTSMSPALALLTTQKMPIYPDMPVTLKRLANAAGEDPLYRTLGFRMYRGRGDLLGWIGDTRTREFVDVGDEPNYAIQPPMGHNPFVRPLGSLLFLRERPMSVSFFQDRRVFGGGSFFAGSDNTGRVGTLFFSAQGDYYNFDERVALNVSGQALTFELAARRKEEIRHLVSLERLVVLTNCSVWTIGGHVGSPLDYDSVDARQNDDVGSSAVTPVVIDGVVLFIRTKGSGARALLPQAADTPYQGLNISEFASHLFLGAGRTVVDWCYAEDPWGVVWAARADGALLSLTFDRARDMAAWARHDTDGEVEAVCSVPEGEEDAVYLVVKRTTANGDVRYIERMTSRVRRVLETDPAPEYVANPTVDDTDTLYPGDVCVDCAFTYAGAPVRDFITDPDLLALQGKQVYVIARGSPVLGPYEVRRVGLNGSIALDLPELPTPNAVDDTNTPIWVAHVGLLFTPELETLDVAGGEARLRKKTIARVGFEVDNSRGLSVGQDFEHIKEWRQRQVQNNYDPISAANALVDTPVASVWDQAARAVLRQTLPLPVTVVGITRELSLDEG